MPNDVSIDSRYAQLPDEELIWLLQMRIKDLENKLKLADQRLNEMRSKLIGSLIVLILMTALLLASFALTMAPYIVGRGNVPQVLSYVSAFLVVIVGFLTYRAYERCYTVLEGQRYLRDNVEEGKLVVEKAQPVLAMIVGSASAH